MIALTNISLLVITGATASLSQYLNRHSSKHFSYLLSALSSLFISGLAFASISLISFCFCTYQITPTLFQFASSAFIQWVILSLPQLLELTQINSTTPVELPQLSSEKLRTIDLYRRIWSSTHPDCMQDFVAGLNAVTEKEIEQLNNLLTLNTKEKVEALNQFLSDGSLSEQNKMCYVALRAFYEKRLLKEDMLTFLSYVQFARDFQIKGLKVLKTDFHEKEMNALLLEAATYNIKRPSSYYTTDNPENCLQKSVTQILGHPSESPDSHLGGSILHLKIEESDGIPYFIQHLFRDVNFSFPHLVKRSCPDYEVMCPSYYLWLKSAYLWHGKPPTHIYANPVFGMSSIKTMGKQLKKGLRDIAWPCPPLDRRLYREKIHGSFVTSTELCIHDLYHLVVTPRIADQETIKAIMDLEERLFKFSKETTVSCETPSWLNRARAKITDFEAREDFTDEKIMSHLVQSSFELALDALFFNQKGENVPEYLPNPLNLNKGTIEILHQLITLYMSYIAEKQDLDYNPMLFNKDEQDILFNGLMDCTYFPFWAWKRYLWQMTAYRIPKGNKFNISQKGEITLSDNYSGQ